MWFYCTGKIYKSGHFYLNSLHFLCQIYEMLKGNLKDDDQNKVLILVLTLLCYTICRHVTHFYHPYTDTWLIQSHIQIQTNGSISLKAAFVLYQTENPNPNLVLSFCFQIGKCNNKIIQSCAKVKKRNKVGEYFTP